MKHRGLVIDGVIALLLVMAGASIALTYLHATARKNYFFEWEIMPATVMACGGGFNQPVNPLPALAAFATRQAETFDCAALTGVKLGPGAAIANQNRYGLYGPMLAMAVNGVSWRSLEAYVATLFGFAVALAYAFLRMFTMRGIAMVTALVGLAMSHRVYEILSHRDYIKEPPFLAMLVIMTWVAIRERTRRDIWSAAGVGGLVLGIGIGCRADLIIIAPFFAAVLLLFVPWPAPDRGLRNRLVALALFAAGFAVTATPILRTVSGGSNLSHTLLMGFVKPFTLHLGLQVPAYDLGTIYSDGYAYTLIAAQARLREGNLGPVKFGQPEYDAAGVRLLVDVARKFPADMLARAYGAVLEALARPFLHESGVYSRDLDGFKASAFHRPALWRHAVFLKIEGHGVATMIAALIIAAAVNLRLAVFAAAVVIYFGAYTMLQYSPRHAFHLDIFAFAGPAFLVQVAAALIVSRWRRRWPLSVGWQRAAVNAVAFTLVMAIVLSAPLWLLRRYQQPVVAQMLDTTLAATNVAVPFVVSPAPDGAVLISSEALGQRIGPGPIDDVRDVRMEYVVATLGGAACGTEPFEVRLTYTGVARFSTDKEFNRGFPVTPPKSGETVRVLTPFFYEYGPYWLKTDGLLLPADRVGCLTALTRAEAPGALPMPFLYATLDQDWRGSPLYQRFRWE